MTDKSRNTTRRRLLRGAAATGLLYGSIGVGAADEQDPLDEAVGTASSTTGEVGEVVYPPKIETIRSPLAMNPAIHEGGETLRLELDSETGVADPTVTVQPTFGQVRPETELDAIVVGEEPSDLWLDEGRPEMTVIEAELPPVVADAASAGQPLTPGLYDVTVSWKDGEESDTQPRSLSLRETFPDEPRIYVVSDAHAGDPRALQSGLEESAAEGDPDPFLFRYENVLGVGTDTERWGGFRRAVAEVSALDPDIVLFPGDFAFGQDAPGKYYQEYADAYAMLSGLRAPVYTAVGNHDGYIQGETDGKAIYHEFVGPWYWSRELREGFRLTCFDTYDWAELDRLGVSYGVSAWGGQVREEQLERLGLVLREWREATPDGTHVSFSHHSPAWRQDEGNPAHDEADGTPVAEQAARGAGDYAVGSSGAQKWRGGGRLETRDLIGSVDTVLHLSGHEHRDRLSRETDDGDIVYTPEDEVGLGRYDREDADVAGDYSQAELETALTDGEGTLYVDATTAGSETTQYWGWRAYDVDGDAVDPSAFGYQPDDPEAFLDERAVEVGTWPAEHAALGRYSHPSFEFDIERLATDDAAAVRIHNGLESEQEGTLLLSLSFEARPAVEGGDLLWRRVGDGRQDVTVAYSVDAASEQDLRVSPPGS